MKLREISKPTTVKSLNENLAKMFNTTIDVDTFTLEQLQDARNKLRTTLSQIETNESFDAPSNNASYQKNKMFLDVINKAISERNILEANAKPDYIDIDKDGDKKEPMKKAVKDKNNKKDSEVDEGWVDSAKRFLSKGKNKPPRTATTGMNWKDSLGKMDFDFDVPDFEMPDFLKRKRKKTHAQRRGNLRDFLRKRYGENTVNNIDMYHQMLKEGEEDKAELVMAAKDMVDRITAWMEDTAQMQTESMLELGDAIRDELGQQQSQQFIDTIKPALDTLYKSLESTRGTLTKGVTMLTGEEMPTPMGEEPGMEEPAMEEPAMEPTVDAEAEMGDEFAAAEPAAGGMEETGREKRESIERQLKKYKIFEQQKLSRTLGIILSSKKK